jgi:hypothetical protein
VKLPWGQGKNKEDEAWKKLKDTVDSVFEATKGEREKMTRYLDLYNGKIWKEEKLEETDSRAFLNLFFSTVQMIAPMLTDNRPRAILVSHEAHLQEVANVYNQALKYFWEAKDMTNKFLLGVMDALIMRLGIFKVYFDPSDGFGGNVDVEIIDPREFFIAPGFTDTWKAPWCGQRTRKPLSWVKKMFPDIKDVKPDGDQGDFDIKYGEAMDFQLDTKFVTVTEVWMRDEEAEEEITEEDEEGKKRKAKRQKYPYGKFCYFTEKEYLGTIPCDYMFNRAPYVPLYDYVKPHDFIGTGEIDNIEGLVLETNLIFQAMVNHFRKYHNPNVIADISCGVDIGTLKETYHKGGQFYAYDTRDSQNKDPVRAIQEPQLNPISRELFNLAPRLLEEITGVTEIAKGVLTTKQERSASEASILIESSYTRIRQRVRNLEWTIRRVMYLVVRLMQQYYMEPRTFWTKQDDEITYETLSNTRATAERIIRDPIAERNIEENRNLTPEQQAREEDYKKLVASVDSDMDPVFFDFDVVVDTNSTLPMDKQSLANLAMKLFERKAIDEQALLETVQWPRADEVIARLKGAMEERKEGPKTGGEIPEIPEGAMPLEEFMNQGGAQ